MKKKPTRPLTREALALVTGGGGIVRLIRGSEPEPGPAEAEFRTIAYAD